MSLGRISVLQDESQSTITASALGVTFQFQAPALPAHVGRTGTVTFQPDHVLVHNGCSVRLPMNYLQPNHGQNVNAYVISLRLNPNKVPPLQH